MCAIKLTYFEIAGRAEPARLAFSIGDIKFEDERIPMEKFLEMKAAGAFTFGSLPVMTVDGEMYAQSDAILRYAGKLSGLYPDDLLEALRVDEVLAACDDIFITTGKGKSKEVRDKCLQEDMPRYFAPMDKLFGMSTDGPFLLGDKLTVADLKVYVMVRILVSGYFDHFPTVQDDLVGDYENIKKVLDAVAANKKVTEWEQAHQS